MQEEGDKALLERAVSGDDESLGRLLERHQSQVYRFGMRMCRDPEDAKDVLQETLFAAARGVRDFRGASSISTWLFTIARSFCIKKRRKEKHAQGEARSHERDEAPEVERVADPASSPYDELASKEIGRALDEAIGALDPIYREVLLLRDVEGLTAPEVAEVVGITVAAVKTRLHRARLTVRERIAPLLDVPSEAVAPEGKCPDVLASFSEHVEGELSAAACAEMERHIERCPRCRSACDGLKQTLAMCRAAGPSVEVPASIRAEAQEALRAFFAQKA